MSSEIQYKGHTYRKINDTWYDSDSFIRVPASLSRELDVTLKREKFAEADLEPVTITKKTKRRNREKGFEQEEVLPVIAEIIRSEADNGDYVTHHEIVDALLDHPEGSDLVEKAQERRGHSRKRWASWMVQSFSSSISSEASDYGQSFERARQDGTWAYRPA